MGCGGCRCSGRDGWITSFVDVDLIRIERILARMSMDFLFEDGFRLLPVRRVGRVDREQSPGRLLAWLAWAVAADITP